MAGWIGVDLDGTLAYHEPLTPVDRVGKPIPRMLDRVKEWVRTGQEVRIVTARAAIESQIPIIQDWLEEQGLPRFAVTDKKDFRMIALYDDRAVQVVSNTGIVVMAPVEPTIVLPRDD